jgi:dTDP-4-dehydrorhamnose reductase
VKITVLGAQGMLGSDVTKAAEQAGHDVTPLGHAELDITDPKALNMRLEIDRPDAVVNCAAWTNVDGAEDDPEGAHLMNGTAAGYVAEAAARIEADVLYMSSDYVFDGRKGTDYVESDEPDPISTYGRSKLAGEASTAEANKRSYIVRSSWLFGENGKNFVSTMLELGASRDEVTVVEDQVGSPTNTWHLAGALVRLLESGDFGIHHISAGGGCSWYEFAREIFALSKVEVRTLATSTESFGAKAPRPSYSVLTSENPQAIKLPSWQVGLADYLAQGRVPAKGGNS